MLEIYSINKYELYFKYIGIQISFSIHILHFPVTLILFYDSVLTFTISDFCEIFQATLIVENVHLHLLPSMNPDGFSLRKRGNANNIDLNRDFP